MRRSDWSSDVCSSDHGWGIVIYNRRVALRQRSSEGWSGIDVQLRRRADLIPNLVSTVKGYAAHESGILETVTELRAQAQEASGSGPAARQQAEGALSGALVRLFAVAEGYPELKADGNFLELQQALAEIEDQIQMSRRSEEHTSELQSLMRISYAVFCL